MLLQTVRTTPQGQLISRRPGADGVAGNAQALSIMAGLVRQDARREDLRNWLNANVLKGVRGHDFENEITRCYRWVKDAVTYRGDPVEVERLQDLPTTIRTLTGDCKAKSTALATMLALIGHKPFFMVMAQRPMAGNPKGEFDHVYVCVPFNGQFKMLDPTPEGAKPGWQAPRVFARMAYRIFEN